MTKIECILRPDRISDVRNVLGKPGHQGNDRNGSDRLRFAERSYSR